MIETDRIGHAQINRSAGRISNPGRKNGNSSTPQADETRYFCKQKKQ